MISPIFEYFVIIVGGLAVLAGLFVLVSEFPTSGIYFIVAAAVGTAVVTGLVFFFTRKPA